MPTPGVVVAVCDTPTGSIGALACLSRVVPPKLGRKVTLPRYQYHRLWCYKLTKVRIYHRWGCAVRGPSGTKREKQNEQFLGGGKTNLFG